MTANSLESIIREAVLKELHQDCLEEQGTKGIKIGVSARHLHVTKEHLEVLFGADAVLTFKKELMGGQFAANERVTLVGTNLRVIENVRILGPIRSMTQVELSKTDARKLGLAAPIRPSGNIAGSSPITIVGPKGAIHLKEGCIIAQRHIHMNLDDAKNLSVKDQEVVSVKVENNDREGILKHVLVRVDESYTLEMHIDTDEANGLSIKTGDEITIINKN